MNSSSESVRAQTPCPESRPLYSKIISAVHKRGWRAAPSGAVLYALRRCESLWYDLAHRVNTRHKIPLSKLDIGGEAARYALSYEASDTNCLRKLLRGLRIEYEKFEFVDLGAGKGRSLFVAAEFPFRQIWGCELAPSLAETARRNCETFRSRRQACKNFKVICGDAAGFDFSKAPLVIYLFNPFAGSILSRVVNNLEQSLQNHSREIIIVYHHSVDSHIIRSSPLFDILASGTDEWDYRKLRYMVFRSKPLLTCREELRPLGKNAEVKNVDGGMFLSPEVSYKAPVRGSAAKQG